MTTSRPTFKLNRDIFPKLANDPGVIAALDDVAEEVADYLRASLPKGVPKDVVVISEVTNYVDGRPVRLVTVRHPSAIAHQAHTGFMTKAAQAVTGAELVSKGGG